jgi:Ca2+-transporting ATPase
MRSVVAVKDPEFFETIRVYVKGAPEVVVPYCSFKYNPTGQKVQIDHYEALQAMHDQITSKGLRALAFSYRDFIIGMSDPLREGVAKSIEFAKKGNITVRMISGDNLETAKGVALESGILKPNEVDNSKYVMEAS